jgi:perosamine synthetase
MPKSLNFYPYGKQSLDSEDIEAVVQTLKSDFLTTGPAVDEFERALESEAGVAHSIAISSGTAALHAAYFAAGVKPGDEIITTPLTFAATANAALYLGAKVKFVDVDEETGNLDPALLEEAIGPKTKLIAAVDFAGHPADYEKIQEIARANGLVTVGDAAHSLGATYQGRPVGQLADLTTLSFHPLKLITSAEGGAVLTDSPEYAQKLRDFRTHGIVKDKDRLLSPDEGPWFHEMQSLGFNYRLSDVQAALGRSQLAKLDRFLKRRQEIAKAYDEAFSDLPGIQLPIEKEEVSSAWHLYVLRVSDGAKARRRLFEKMQSLKLGVQVHYIPVYWHPHYQELGYSKGLCPKAETFYEQAISIPIYPALLDSDLQEIQERVRKAVRSTL